MIEASQIPEVAVLSERELGVARAREQVRAEQERDPVGPHRVPEPLSALCEHGGMVTQPASQLARLLGRVDADWARAALEMIG